MFLVYSNELVMNLIFSSKLFSFIYAINFFHVHIVNNERLFYRQTHDNHKLHIYLNANERFSIDN